MSVRGIGLLKAKRLRICGCARHHPVNKRSCCSRSCRLQFSGSENVNVVLPPRRDCAQSLPSSDSTIALQIRRPIPIPVLFVVKKGSNTLSGSLSPDPRSEMKISTLAPHLLRPIEPIELTASACNGQLYEAYLRGLAYLRLNDGHSAALHFQKLIDHPGIVQGSIVGGLVHLQLARAEMLMGNKDAARKS